MQDLPGPYPAPVTGALPLRLLFLQGSNKKVPPATQVMRVKQPGSHSAMKREKRFSTSSFPLSANRELQKLPALAGMRFSLQAIWLATAVEGGVQLSLTSPDGDQGYPGEVQVSVSYTLQVRTPGPGALLFIHRGLLLARIFSLKSFGS